MPVNQEDRKSIVTRLNKAYGDAKNRIFVFGDPFGMGERRLRSFIPPFPKMLQNIPECAKKYKVDEIIEVLLDAYHKGELLLP
jgi:hypothetical protein